MPGCCHTGPLRWSQMSAADLPSRRFLLTRDLPEAYARAFRLAAREATLAGAASPGEFARSMRAKATFHLGRDRAPGVFQVSAASNLAWPLWEAIDLYVRSPLYMRLRALPREHLHLSDDPSVDLIVSGRDRWFGVRFGSVDLFSPKKRMCANGDLKFAALVVYDIVTGACQTRYAPKHRWLRIAS
jgi:hypothetical protein